MRRILFAASLLLCFASVSGAQITAVTGTIVDPAALPYAGGTLKAQLVLAGAGLTGQATVTVNNAQQCRSAGQGSAPCQVPFQGTAGPLTLDSTGSFSLNLQDNSLVTPAGTQWLFSVTITPGVPPPAGNGPQSCFATVTITGASQSVTSSFSCPLLAKPVTPGAAGSPGQIITNNGGVLAGTPCETLPNNATGPVNVNCDWHSGGPNPYIDITAPQYGARAVNPNAAPATSGITVSCTSGSPSVTISGASTFVKGDGVVAQACGAAPTMATPTITSVTPSVSNGDVETNKVVNSATGATTYNYRVFGVDTQGGKTAATAPTTIATGLASLGNQQINITSWTRSNKTVTVTTATAHPLLVGCGSCGQVLMSNGNSISDASVVGKFTVTTVADSTHFTFDSDMDTRNGATTSGTGGVAIFYTSNHLVFGSTAGLWKWIACSDRANPGTYVRVAQSPPQGANTQLAVDDYGSPFNDNQVFPWFTSDADCTAGSPTNQWLSTTISSGAGSTSLTLAANAGNTISGQGFRVDACPGIKAAAVSSAANGASGGTVVIPAIGTSGNVFVINSTCDISANNIVVSQMGAIQANETLKGSITRYYGDRSPQAGIFNSGGAMQGGPAFVPNGAYPGLYNDCSTLNGCLLQGVTFGNQSVANGALDVLYEGSFNIHFIGNTFTTATGNNDYLGIGLECRGSAGQSCTNVTIDRDLFSSGGPVSNSGTTAPLFLCNFCGNVTTRAAYFLHRGTSITTVAAGGTWTIHQSYINGGFGPLYTVNPGSGSTTFDVNGSITLDTYSWPCIDNLAGGGTSTFFAGPVCTPSSAGPGNPPPVAGNPSGFQQGSSNLSGSFPGSAGLGANRDGTGVLSNSSGAFDGLLNDATGNGAPYNVEAHNDALAVGQNYKFFVDAAAPAAPTCAVVAGGSLAIGSYTFKVVPQWWDGGEGKISPASTTCTTSSGNQQINITLPAISGNPQTCIVYQSFNSGGYSEPTTLAPSQPCNSVVNWTSSGVTQRTQQLTPTSGPVEMFGGASPGISTPKLTINGNCSSSASPAVCGSAASGSVAIAAGATTLTVNTTAVTANSQIELWRDDSLGTKLGVTCNTATVMGEMKVSTRTAGTNFVITVQTAPVTNPGCVSYSIQN